MPEVQPAISYSLRNTFQQNHLLLRRRRLGENRRREKSAGKAGRRLPLPAEKPASRPLRKRTAGCSGRSPGAAAPGRAAASDASAKSPPGAAFHPALPGAAAGAPCFLRGRRRTAPAGARRSRAGYRLPGGSGRRRRAVPPRSTSSFYPFPPGSPFSRPSRPCTGKWEPT